LQRLNLWLKDLIHSGLAGVEQKPGSFWEEQAKRLVDAQAGGLASRISRLGEIPRSGRDWPQRLLSELGKIRLLTHAYSRLSELTPELQLEVRQLIGWNLGQDELDRDGEHISDKWAIYGQSMEDDGRIRTQRSWLVGRETNQTVMILQFAAGSQPFAEPLIAGTELPGTLVFYPGTVKQRAKFMERAGNVMPIETRVPGFNSIEDFLKSAAELFGRQPWISGTAGVLCDVNVFPREGRWLVRDQKGEGLLLEGPPAWKLLAVSGGDPVDFTVEWDGENARPLGYFWQGNFGAL